MSNLTGTYKSSDTEEWIDIWFYRPIGYQIALFAKWLKVTPNEVTVFSFFWGILAGVLFYFNDLALNIAGMLSLMFANSLDSADGQLARMTDQKSRLGRFLDGLAGNFWFFAIYLGLVLRLTNEGTEWWIWIFAAVTGYTHAFQAKMADYHRNAYLLFLKGESGSELDKAEKLQQQYDQLSWKKNFFEKVYMKMYTSYTKEQEMASPAFQKLMMKLKTQGSIPENIRQEYLNNVRPLLWITNTLSFNARAIALFIALFTNFIWFYWIFEISILNILLVYLIVRTEKTSKKLCAKLDINE